MIRRLIARIATPPTTDTVPRWLFLALAVIIGIFVVIDIFILTRGGGPTLRRLVGDIGVFLMMVFFYSRQRQVRLLCYFCGMACILFWIVGDLALLIPRRI